MADNYLENKMEEYRAGKLGRRSPRPVVSPQRREGELVVKYPRLRVYVTGGADGIGREIVKSFREIDCRVAFCDINTKAGTALAQDCGARFYPLDVSDSAALERSLADVAGAWGDIDVIVNNVGVGDFKPLPTLAIDALPRVIDTNLRPVMLTARFIARHRQAMTEANPFGGRIVNICSTRCMMSEAGTEAYSATKGAVASLTHALMMSLAPLRITVNAISPGWIEVKDYDSLRPVDHECHPSRRVGRPGDVARLCRFLCHPDNDFVNGVNIPVDGGMTRCMIYPE
ncbi:MAG: SDR family oxidoreductase [Duncaniella sp.]|nr:SDR family oxidoreductase [Duncaniella sp.]